MNQLEAKFILEACRPDSMDCEDPRVAAALAMVETDEELKQWYRDMVSADEVIRQKLRSVAVPGELRERIRAGERMSSTVPEGVTRRSGMKLAAAAAGVALLGGALPWLLHRKAESLSYVQFRKDMVHFLDVEWDRSLDFIDPQFSNIQEWLDASEKADAKGIEVPAGLASNQAIGCKLFRWNGAVGTLICFMPEGVGSVVHLMMIHGKSVRTKPLSEVEMARVGDWNTAIWLRDEKVYLVLTQADSSRLKDCI